MRVATIAKVYIVYMKFAATVKGRLLFKAEIQYISMSISIKLKIRQPLPLQRSAYALCPMRSVLR